MATPAKHDARARAYLIALAVLASIAAVTATGLYSYPETLGPIAAPMVVLHLASGDLAVVVSGLYLLNHLARTWKMKKLKVSRWSGLVVVALWLVASATGVWGHFVVLEEGGWLWRLHFVASLATIILVCFHGAWAFRPRRQTA